MIATLPNTDELAEGAVTTWAGEIRVKTSLAGVRSVCVPKWTDTAIPMLVVGAVVVSERGDDAALNHLRQALDELAEFFANRKRTFTVALDPHGSAFRRRAWAAVAAVPYGETRSYTDIARTIGAPLAVRAVGAANGANPIAPLVPCHRIVGGDGRLTGYGPGLPLKQRLLAMEGAIPCSDADYPAWVERVSERIGSADWVLGVRATGVYCQPRILHSLHYRLLPNRVFATREAAEEAGFASCSVCYPLHL
jgi:methylated-DNA-[protein]-cysteine S-methyltransferase